MWDGNAFLCTDSLNSCVVPVFFFFPQNQRHNLQTITDFRNRCNHSIFYLWSRNSWISEHHWWETYWNLRRLLFNYVVINHLSVQILSHFLHVFWYAAYVFCWLCGTFSIFSALALKLVFTNWSNSQEQYENLWLTRARVMKWQLVYDQCKFSSSYHSYPITPADMYIHLYISPGRRKLRDNCKESPEALCNRFTIRWISLTM